MPYPETQPASKSARVGSAVEVVTYEKIERKSNVFLTICVPYGEISDNVLDNERLQVDFTPLYQCIHIYGALDALDEIRRSYQADRKVSLNILRNIIPC